MIQVDQCHSYVSRQTPGRRSEPLIYVGVRLSYWEKANLDFVEYGTENNWFRACH